MRRWFCLALTLLLALTVLAACGKPDSGAASSESSSVPGTESSEESGPGDTSAAKETAALLALRGKTLYGPTEEAYAEKFDEVRVQRPEEAEGADGAEEPEGAENAAWSVMEPAEEDGASGVLVQLDFDLDGSTMWDNSSAERVSQNEFVVKISSTIKPHNTVK